MRSKNYNNALKNLFNKYARECLVVQKNNLNAN